MQSGLCSLPMPATQPAILLEDKPEQLLVTQSMCRACDSNALAGSTSYFDGNQHDQRLMCREQLMLTTEAPRLSSRRHTLQWPCEAARCRGRLPRSPSTSWAEHAVSAASSGKYCSHI